MQKGPLSLLSAVVVSSALIACSSNDGASEGAGAADATAEGASSTTDSGSGSHDGGANTDSGLKETGAPEAASPDGTSPEAGGLDATSPGADGSAPGTDGGTDAAGPTQVLVTTVDPGVVAIAVTINQGTAIGEGSLNGATPSTLANLAVDSNNSQTVVSALEPVRRDRKRPRHRGRLLRLHRATPATRITHVTGAKFESPGADGGPGTDPMVPMAPFYFPLVYTTTNTTTDNAFGGQPPIIGLFDWRPKDIDEAVVVAESDDNGHTWYFMQTVLELNPDYTNPSAAGTRPRPRAPAARRRSRARTPARRRPTDRPRTTAGVTRRSSSCPAQGT